MKPIFQRADGCSGGNYKCEACGRAWVDHVLPQRLCPTPLYHEGGNEQAQGVLLNGAFVFLTAYADPLELVDFASAEERRQAVALFLEAPAMLEALRTFTEILVGADAAVAEQLADARAILQRIEKE